MHCSGPKNGYVFSKGAKGVGYYRDGTAAKSAGQSAPEANGQAAGDAPADSTMAEDDGGVMQLLEGAARMILSLLIHAFHKYCHR